MNRIRRCAIRTYANGIDTDAEGLGYLSCCQGRNLASVVRAVSQQDDNLRLSLTVLQAGNSIRNTIANGSTIHDCAVLNHIARDIVEDVQEHCMVRRERALREALSCKYSQTNIVIRPPVDEVSRHLFSSFQAIRLEVFSQHTGGDIHCHHNVDALDLTPLPAVGGLWTSKHDDEQHQSSYTKQERQVTQPRQRTLRQLVIHGSSRDLHGGLATVITKQIPNDESSPYYVPEDKRLSVF